jgi:hypothetical protein
MPENMSAIVELLSLCVICVVCVDRALAKPNPSEGWCSVQRFQFATEIVSLPQVSEFAAYTYVAALDASAMAPICDVLFARRESMISQRR